MHMSYIQPCGKGKYRFKFSILAFLTNSFQAILSQFRQAKRRSCDATADSREEEDGDEEIEDEEDEADEEDENAEEESDDELDPDREARDELEIEEIGREVDRIQKATVADVLLGQSAMSKVMNTSPNCTCTERHYQISKLATRIAHSPLMTDDLAECCKKAGIASKTIKRPVPTRWNSVAEMLWSAIQLCTPLNKLVLIDWHNTNAKSRIKKFKLKKEEWDLLMQLEPILVVSSLLVHRWMLIVFLQMFLIATERMSQNKVPLLHEVIPIIDVLTDRLEAATGDLTLHAAVRAAAAKGLAILNKYYAKTDDSIMYRMVMSMLSSFQTILCLHF